MDNIWLYEHNTYDKNIKLRYQHSTVLIYFLDIRNDKLSKS